MAKKNVPYQLTQDAVGKASNEPIVEIKTSELADVDSTTPTQGQVLAYDDTSSTYKPTDVESGTTTDISGKADTDLGNVDSDLTDSEKATFKTKLGITDGGGGGATTEQLNAKADADLSNLDSALTSTEQSTIQTKLGISSSGGGGDLSNVRQLPVGGVYPQYATPSPNSPGSYEWRSIPGIAEVTADTISKLVNVYKEPGCDYDRASSADITTPVGTNPVCAVEDPSNSDHFWVCASASGVTHTVYYIDSSGTRTNSKEWTLHADISEPKCIAIVGNYFIVSQDGTTGIEFFVHELDGTFVRKQTIVVNDRLADECIVHFDVSRFYVGRASTATSGDDVKIIASAIDINQSTGLLSRSSDFDITLPGANVDSTYLEFEFHIGQFVWAGADTGTFVCFDLESGSRRSDLDVELGSFSGTGITGNTYRSFITSSHIFRDDGQTGKMFAWDNCLRPVYTKVVDDTYSPESQSYLGARIATASSINSGSEMEFESVVAGAGFEINAYTKRITRSDKLLPDGCTGIWVVAVNDGVEIERVFVQPGFTEYYRQGYLCYIKCSDAYEWVRPRIYFAATDTLIDLSTTSDTLPVNLKLYFHWDSRHVTATQLGDTITFTAQTLTSETTLNTFVIPASTEKMFMIELQVDGVTKARNYIPNVGISSTKPGFNLYYDSSDQKGFYVENKYQNNRHELDIKGINGFVIEANTTVLVKEVHEGHLGDKIFTREFSAGASSYNRAYLASGIIDRQQMNPHTSRINMIVNPDDGGQDGWFFSFYVNNALSDRIFVPRRIPDGSSTNLYSDVSAYLYANLSSTAYVSIGTDTSYSDSSDPGTFVITSFATSGTNVPAFYLDIHKSTRYTGPKIEEEVEEIKTELENSLDTKANVDLSNVDDDLTLQEKQIIRDKLGIDELRPDASAAVIGVKRRLLATATLPSSIEFPSTSTALTTHLLCFNSGTSWTSEDSDDNPFTIENPIKSGSTWENFTVSNSFWPGSQPNNSTGALSSSTSDGDALFYKINFTGNMPINIEVDFEVDGKVVDKSFSLFRYMSHDNSPTESPGRGVFGGIYLWHSQQDLEGPVLNHQKRRITALFPGIAGKVGTNSNRPLQMPDNAKLKIYGYYDDDNVDTETKLLATATIDDNVVFSDQTKDEIYLTSSSGVTWTSEGFEDNPLTIVNPLASGEAYDDYTQVTSWSGISASHIPMTASNTLSATDSGDLLFYKPAFKGKLPLNIIAVLEVGGEEVDKNFISYEWKSLSMQFGAVSESTADGHFGGFNVYSLETIAEKNPKTSGISFRTVVIQGYVTLGTSTDTDGTNTGYPYPLPDDVKIKLYGVYAKAESTEDSPVHVKEGLDKKLLASVFLPDSASEFSGAHNHTQVYIPMDSGIDCQLTQFEDNPLTNNNPLFYGNKFWDYHVYLDYGMTAASHPTGSEDSIKTSTETFQKDLILFKDNFTGNLPLSMTAELATDTDYLTDQSSNIRDKIDLHQSTNNKPFLHHAENDTDESVEKGYLAGITLDHSLSTLITNNSTYANASRMKYIRGLLLKAVSKTGSNSGHPMPWPSGGRVNIYGHYIREFHKQKYSPAFERQLIARTDLLPNSITKASFTTSAGEAVFATDQFNWIFTAGHNLFENRNSTNKAQPLLSYFADTNLSFELVSVQTNELQNENRARILTDQRGDLRFDLSKRPFKEGVNTSTSLLLIQLRPTGEDNNLIRLGFENPSAVSGAGGQFASIANRRYILRVYELRPVKVLV